MVRPAALLAVNPGLGRGGWRGRARSRQGPADGDQDRRRSRQVRCSLDYLIMGQQNYGGDRLRCPGTTLPPSLCPDFGESRGFAMSSCPSCGTDIAPGWLYCATCGAPAEQNLAPGTVLGGRLCWACGTDIAPGSPLCSTCGASAEADQRLAPGTVLGGRYRIDGVLGAGGFGITYDCFDAVSPVRRRVAVKELFPPGSSRQGNTVLPPTYGRATWAETVTSSIGEGRILVGLEDLALPGVIRVHDVVQANNTAYLIMEFLQGQTLEEVVAAAGGRLGQVQVVELARSLCATLDVIHGRNILHRDIKPANIILVQGRGPVLIDFGIAMQFMPSRTTDTTAILTPGFAPLEQYSSQGRFGPYTDIYALAATLYFALVGMVPPDAADRVLGGQADPLRPPATMAPGISAALSDALVQAMSINARRRPQSAREFLLQLDHDAQSAVSPRRQPPPLGDSGKLSGHAFICYAREDSDDVDLLQQRLETAGIPIWRDTADLWPGEDWRANIRRAISDNALVFVACFSRQSVSRDRSYQNEELTLAIEQLRLRPPGIPWLIPVRLDDCDIPDREIGGGRTLASIQRADLFGNKSGEGVARLVGAIQRILEHNSSTAADELSRSTSPTTPPAKNPPAWSAGTSSGATTTASTSDWGDWV
jgi:serine/threonine protein kinase